MPRKSSIEFVMLSEVKEFASLLETFYRELKNNVAIKETIKPINIHAFVCGDTNQLFAFHSAQDLVKASEQITRYEQLFTNVPPKAPAFREGMEGGSEPTGGR